MEKYSKTIGKEMPYLLPDDFFEKNEQELMRRVTTLQTRRRHRLLLWIGGAAAAAILTGIALLPPIMHSEAIELTTPLYSYNESVSTEELRSWVDLYEADIFLSYE